MTGWWYTYPSEKWWSSSVGMMKFPIYGNIIQMFQTTNQMSLGSYKHSSQKPQQGLDAPCQRWSAIMMRPIWTVHHHAALDQIIAKLRYPTKNDLNSLLVNVDLPIDTKRHQKTKGYFNPCKIDLEMLGPRKRLTTRPGVTCFFLHSADQPTFCVKLIWYWLNHWYRSQGAVRLQSIRLSMTSSHVVKEFVCPT